MSPVPADAVRRELDKVLASSGFVRNERLSRFLRFAVERRLGNRDSELKESVIAVEVFGRKPDFDSKHDPIVRTEAARLRARLTEYYVDGGRADPWIIEMPKGGYAPVFREPCLAGIDFGVVRRGWLPFTLSVALAFVCAAAAIALGWRAHQAAKPIPIAVLPLESRGQDAAGNYFSDGLTSEIIRDLSIIDGIVVRSQTSSFAFKGKPRSIREAGKLLDANYILEGSVFREAQKLRINVQFVRVRDDVPIWSSRFDRELKDVLAVQDDISRGIVNSLRLTLGRGRRRYEISTEAYDLYLRGVSLPLRQGLSGYDECVAPLEAAIAKDPSFAPAYAALAVAYAFRSSQPEFEIEEQIRRMRAAADEAIRQDPLLPEAHEAMGVAHARLAEWQQAQQSFHRAIELNPGDALPYRHLAFFVLFPVGRIDEALDQFNKGLKLDPLGSAIHYEMALALMAAGQHKAAESHCEKVSAEWVQKEECLLLARLRQGRVNEVIAAVQPRIENRGQLRLVLASAYARGGRRQDAEQMIAEIPDPLYQARVFAALGDNEQTIEALERAIPEGPFRVGRELEYPEYAAVREDPRLKGVRRKVGLPE
jgi:TolB-like protein/tetratricopeptide (TPR) repeat protein